MKQEQVQRKHQPRGDGDEPDAMWWDMHTPAERARDASASADEFLKRIGDLHDGKEV